MQSSSMGAPRLTGRIAFITGASRGIGAAVARRFAREGATVVLAARTVGALEEVDDLIRSDGGSATLVPLDLQKHDAIDAVASSLYQRFGRVDVLVGNAAMLGALSPVAQADPAKWRQVIDLNLTANHRLIRAFDPLLRVSEAGRAVFTTCDVAHRPVAYWGAYAVAKAGLEMLVRLYAAETAKTPVRVNLIDPGPVQTRLRSEAFPGGDATDVADPDSVTDVFVDLSELACTRTGDRVLGAARTGSTDVPSDS